MGVDYYKLLQVDRNANDYDLKKAYCKLAMIWYRNKNPNNRKDADSKFKLICQAYDVLSDPQKRAIYDRYGEEGLTNQVPPPGSGGFKFNGRNADHLFSEYVGSSAPFSDLRGEPPRAEDVFSEFFGSSVPYSDSGAGPSGGSPSADDIFSKFFGDSPDAKPSGGSPSLDDVFSSGFFQTTLGSPKKADPIERQLPCSLEDLYKGISKKMKITRDVLDSSRRPTKVEELLTIEIKPGWKKGTKITFSEKGNEQPGIIPSDLVFIVDEKPHAVFERDGNDLVIRQKKFPLLDTPDGYNVHVPTLDGRILKVPVNSVISSSYEKVVKGEGMPISKEPSRKGNLIIKFSV